MKAALTKNSLPSNMLVQLGCDGPNVTKAIKNQINVWLKDDEGLGNLFDLGTCHDHILHNALKAGCEIMKDVHILCQQLSDYFKAAQNWADFVAFSGAKLKFVTFFSVRWTTLGPASSRLIELWDEVVSYFEKIVADKTQRKVKLTRSESTISTLLQSEIIKAEITFVKYVASIVEPVLTFLERTDQIVLQAHDRYKEMLRKLIAIVLVPGSEVYENVLLDLEFDENYDYTSDIDVTLFEEIHELEITTRGFHKNMFKFIHKMVTYLNGKDFFHSFLYDVKFISPEYVFKEGSVEKIQAIGKYFEQCNQNINRTQLFEELVLFISPSNQLLYEGITDTDKFYVAVDQSGKCPELFRLFTLVSALTISNAEVERNFSRSKQIISPEMSNLKEENFNARKRIISGMGFFNDDIENFPVATTLVSKVLAAHRNFKRKRDDEKAQQEENGKRQQLDEELTTRMRQAKDTAEAHNKKIEEAIEEAGKLKKDLEVEGKALGSFLTAMATCKDQTRMKILIENSQLSRITISTIEDDYAKIQATIMELQNKRIAKLSQYPSN